MIHENAATRRKSVGLSIADLCIIIIVVCVRVCFMSFVSFHGQLRVYFLINRTNNKAASLVVVSERRAIEICVDFTLTHGNLLRIYQMQEYYRETECSIIVINILNVAWRNLIDTWRVLINFA